MTGNIAVHPGKIDTDDPALVLRLFGLLNMIADDQIAKPKQLAELYADLAKTTREGALPLAQGQRTMPLARVKPMRRPMTRGSTRRVLLAMRWPSESAAEFRLARRLGGVGATRTRYASLLDRAPSFVKPAFICRCALIPRAEDVHTD